MSTLKIAALAAALTAGTVASANAQYVGHGYGHGYGHRYYGGAPTWVHPKIARKQAQLQERFVERYGVVQPRFHNPSPHWGYAYGHGYGHGYRPYGYAHPRPRVHLQYGW
ncbi:MAG: hypothetical protein ACRCTI_11835 [Beijerinckiaceae bacterium]